MVIGKKRYEFLVYVFLGCWLAMHKDSLALLLLESMMVRGSCLQFWEGVFPPDFACFLAFYLDT